MKRPLLFVIILCATFTANAYTARWTGVRQLAKSPSGHDAINCEYDLSGSKFWREFLLSEVANCPGTVEVQ